MISQINLTQQHNINTNTQNEKGAKNTPNFKGGKNIIWNLAKNCEKEPMINVAVIDLVTAIGPRSIWESVTNLFAGFEWSAKARLSS